MRFLEDIAVAAREAGEAILEIVRRGFDVEHKQDARRLPRPTARPS